MRNELVRAPAGEPREYKTAHFVFREDQQGTTTGHLAALAPELEATRAGFIKLIGAHRVPREPVYVDLFAAAQSVASSDADSGATRLADPFLRITGAPNETPEALKRSLIRLLLLATYGEHAGRAQILIDGIYAFLAVDTVESKPTTLPAALARALTRKRVPVATETRSLLSSILSGQTTENRRYYSEAIASFTAFLVASFGVERFQDYARRLCASDATNVAGVLDNVYGRTLATLEREWRASLPAAPAEKHGLVWVVVRALKYWRPYWLMGLAIAGTVCLQDYFGSFFATSLGRITDTAASSDPRVTRTLAPLVLSLAGGLAIWYLITVVAAVVQNYLTARASASILNDLRRGMFAHLQSLSMRYYARSQSGDIVAHFTSDLTDVDKGITSRLPDGYFSIIGIVFWGTSMFVLYGQVALVMLIVVPLLVITTLFFARPTVDATYRLKRQQASLASMVQENTRAQPVVKVFSLQDTSLARLEVLLTDLLHTAIRANFLGQTMGTASALAVTLLTVAFPLIGALLVARGILSIGGLIGANALFALITGEAYNLTKKVIPTLLSSSGAMTRIAELLAEPSDVTDEAGAVELPVPAKAIQVDTVSFGYERERPILDRVSLTIPIGHFIGLVGPSGSGKSTILNLLMRFYDPTLGSVSIDGHSLRHVTQASLHAHMAAVFQDQLLFDVSIRDNIRMGALNATDAEVEAAARGAEIHDLIMSLPDGYDSRTGEMGSLLSGGQRQRLAIARAIVRDPAILLLDEPTSALDPATETAIMQTIERLAQQRTVVAVTHRLAAVEHADAIVLLQAGRVQEQGTHNALLARKGLYYELWQKQHGVEVSPDGRQATVQMSRLQTMPLFEVPLFATLDARILTLLASQFTPTRVAAETIVAKEGDPAGAFFMIARGKLEVLAADAHLNEQSIATLEDGDYFGEVALLADTTYGATLRAAQESLLLTLQRDRFLNLVANLPELRSAIERASASYRMQGMVGTAGGENQGGKRIILQP